MASRMREALRWRSVRLSFVRERAPLDRHLAGGGDVITMLRHHVAGDVREIAAAVYCDAKLQPIATYVVSIGLIDSAPLRPLEVYGPAVALQACAIVLAHGHPSGDPTPSTSDRAVTERMRLAGDVLGIQLLDHIVVGSERFYSFATETFQPYP